LSDEATYLDNTGQLSAGVAVWKLAAADANRLEGLASRAALDAQGALDNALAGNCSDAVNLAAQSLNMPLRGPKATFHAGMAGILCGTRREADRALDALQSFPHNSLVEQSYIPDLRAAELLQSKRPLEAVELLTRQEPSSADPLTSYIRGLAEIALEHDQQAVDDFRSVLEHRGTAFLTGGITYPMAQIQLARALAAVGNQSESVAAYRQFLPLWSKAGKGQGLVIEATARGKTDANLALVSVER